MTAPVVDTAAPADGIPDNAVPIRLPVMVIEGMETSDGRYINAGALTTRTLPIPLYAATRSTHGDQGDAATWHVGAITAAERKPGPEVVQRSTGQPFPEGTFVWEGTGWMYTDVPAAPAKSAFELVRDGALSGNSVDLSQVEAEFEYDEDAAEGAAPRRIAMHAGSIAATTLVGIPAFADAYIELDGQAMGSSTEQVDEPSLAASAWLSAEVGDTCWSCRAGDTLAVSQEKRDKAEEAGHAMPGGRYPIETAEDLDNAIAAVGRAGGPEGTEEDRNAVRRHIIKQAKRLGLEDKIPDTWNADGTLNTDKAATHADALQDELDGLLAGEDIDPPAQDYSTSGMVALIPQNPAILTVPGGDPAEQMHLTMAYLGDEVDTWDPDVLAAVHQIAREFTDRDAEAERIRRDAVERGEPEPEVSSYVSDFQRGPLTLTVFSHAVFNPNGDNGFDPATVYLFDGGGDRDAIEFAHGGLLSRLNNAIGDVNMPQQHTPFIPHVTAGYGVPIDQLTYTGEIVFDRLRVAIGDDVTDYPLGGAHPGGQEPPVIMASAALPPASIFDNPKLAEPTPPTVRDDGTAYGHLACWGTCHIGFQGQCVTPPRSATDYAYFKVHSVRALADDGQPVAIPVGYATIGTGHAGMRASASEAAAHYDNTGTAAFEINVGEDDHGIWFAGRLLPGLDEVTEHRARGTVFSGDWRTIRGQLELVAALGVNTPGFPVPRARVASGTPVAIVAAGAPRPALRDPEPAGERITREELAWLRAQRYAEQQRAALDELGALLDNSPDLAHTAFLAEVELLLALHADHPWFAKRKNWVEKAGGLPSYIKRIAKHLQKKGYDESRAIATAVNAAKKMCSTGDTSLPGVQNINAGSRAQACAAVASWERKKAQS
jgi:hypothetical protein